MYQRFPLYARPLPFVVGMALFLGGLWKALAWNVDWSLQTGNVFLQISVPASLLVLEGLNLAYLGVSVAGLALVVFLGAIGRRAATEALRRGTHWLLMPRFRFYPLTLLFGLFVTYFGIVFLFNASVSGDETPNGVVAFVYLNYAGIVRRGIISILALVLLIGGACCASLFAFRRGLDITVRQVPLAAATARAAQPVLVAPAPRPAMINPATPSPTRSTMRPPVARPAARRTPRAAPTLKPGAPTARPRAPSASRTS